MSIAERITAARERAGLTQTELARRLGIRPQSVQQWENGLSAPRARRLSEVAAALGVEESYFFHRHDEADVATEGEGVTEIDSLARTLSAEIIAGAGRGALDREALQALNALVKGLRKNPANS